MKFSLKISFVLLTITMTIVICGGASGKMNADKPNLPKTVGVWNRLEPPRIINSKNIFKYMNGAGELYLGYRFRHLEVFDYTSPDQGAIYGLPNQLKLFDIQEGIKIFYPKKFWPGHVKSGG